MGTAAADMIASLKFNNRRKKRKAFDNSKEYKKGNSISSIKLTSEEKDRIQLKLKIQREDESKKRVYKLIISMVITFAFIGSLITFLKLAFFE